MILPHKFKHAVFYGYFYSFKRFVRPEYYTELNHDSPKIIRLFVAAPSRSGIGIYRLLVDKNNRAFYSSAFKLHISEGLIYDYDMFYVVKSGDNSYCVHPAFIRKYPLIAKYIMKNHDVKVTPNVLKDNIHEYDNLNHVKIMYDFLYNMTTSTVNPTYIMNIFHRYMKENMSLNEFYDILSDYTR